MPPDSGADARLALVSGYRPMADLLPSHWRQGYVTANGLRHHYYRTGGVKPPLVMLHGILDSALTWLRTALALEDGYDVILIDTRGHGRSDRIGDDYSASLLADDAAQVIAQLSAGPADLVGHSQGGVTGILVAAEHPELVRSLLVEGAGEDDAAAPNTDFVSSPGYQAWLAAYADWLEALKSQTHGQRLASALAQLPPGAPVLPELDYVAWVESCATVDLALVRRSGALWGALGETARAMRAAQDKLTCPTLIMRSGAWPVPGAEAEVERLPSTRANVEELRLVNVGHLVHQEQYELFIGETRRFLGM